MNRVVLTRPQSRVWNAQCRFRTVVCGRRFGKTFLALTWLLSRAMSIPGQHWYAAPTYVAAKSIAWRLAKELAGNRYVKSNESELYLEFRNGGILSLKGAEKYDALRGNSLASLVLDEFAYMRQEVWTEVLRPATADRLAPVIFITSPAGWNWAKDLYDYAVSGKSKDWQGFTFTTAEGGNVSQEEIEAARNELPASTFRQEFLASFETLANRVYSNFDRFSNVDADLAQPTDARELLIGMDFNVDPMCAIVGVKVADQVHIVDEIKLPNSNTQEMAAEIKRRYPKHKIKVFPDPSGRARKTSAGGQTDFTLLTQAGFSVIAPRKAPPVRDRINQVQAALKNANGLSRLFFAPHCTEIIRGMEGQTWVNGEPDKSGGLDHMNDALGYLIHSVMPLRTFAMKGVGSAV
jgi:hypothetical protein